MDLPSLTSTQVALLTVAATVTVGFIAGVFGVTVALINGRSAKRLDIAKARREYLQRVLDPYFTKLDGEIVLCSQIASFLIETSSANPRDVDTAKFEELFKPFRDQRFVDATSTAVQALALRHQASSTAFQNLSQARNNLIDASHAVVYLITSGDQARWQSEKIAAFSRNAQLFVKCATHFREHLEDFMFAGR